MYICIIWYIILLQVCWEFEIRVIGSEGSESFNLLFFIIVLHDMLVSTRYVYVYLCTVWCPALVCLC